MKLSGLLRYLLYECHDKVSIRREVEALHAYAELFQLKYEKPLNLQIFVPDGLSDKTLEPLLLIPILENATKHSGLGFQPEAFVHLKLTWSDHLLTCVVRNSKSQNTEDSPASGIGLSNIKKRLQLISPGEDRLLIDDNESAFCITLNLSLS
jgi:LytS/YehU family sensor histidine kinase